MGVRVPLLAHYLTKSTVMKKLLFLLLIVLAACEERSPNTYPVRDEDGHLQEKAVCEVHDGYLEVVYPFSLTRHKMKMTKFYNIIDTSGPFITYYANDIRLAIRYQDTIWLTIPIR